MSGETSARLGLPLMQPGQAQKEMIHNEALSLLELAVQTSVATAGTNVPPAAPAMGESWIVGDVPTGGWAGHARQVAGWTAGGWRFATPREGMVAWCEADRRPLRYMAGNWGVAVIAGARVEIDGQAVVGARRPGIADIAGGVAIDAEARAAVQAILGVLRGHGLIEA